MAVTSNLLQILNSLSVDEKQVLLNVDGISTLPSTREFNVMGSLTVNNETVTRRLPIDSEENKLADWKEKISFVFHRFLGEENFNIFYTGILFLYNFLGGVGS